MRSSSLRPCGSKRQRSTAVAWAENRAKLTPLPSKVAPSGAGAPSSIRNIVVLSGTVRREEKAYQHNARTGIRVRDFGGDQFLTVLHGVLARPLVEGRLPAA